MANGSVGKLERSHKGGDFLLMTTRLAPLDVSATDRPGIFASFTPVAIVPMTALERRRPIESGDFRTNSETIIRYD
jgi:hypothetical protein